MKLNETAFALASGVTAGILWIVCSFIVYVLPGPMLRMTGHMVHGDFTMMSWSLSIGGILLGLIAWVFVSALTGWLLAFTYNRFADGSSRVSASG